MKPVYNGPTTLKDFPPEVQPGTLVRMNFQWCGSTIHTIVLPVNMGSGECDYDTACTILAGSNIVRLVVSRGRSDSVTAGGLHYIDVLDNDTGRVRIFAKWLTMIQVVTGESSNNGTNKHGTTTTTRIL